MRKRVLKAALTAGALSAVVVAALATGRTAPPQQELTLRPVAEEGPGHAVENVAHPQADKMSTPLVGEGNQYDVAANSWAAVGETADPEGREHVLVEIDTSG
ncbi:hypothetical protein OG402_23805 [Streptomyces anulatus]|uniref:hypothetical protein n=2 Tax=Streptomyces anulatus TaxID=1892 RepID=UPI002256EB81|nr:hypothetical protein [Streptomyces anulatus]MCX4520620.1 hypothetical protein [Streptomyces anulatus]MCX4603489.1 hypothetical protein [Streptomyces anulatus]